MKAVLLLLIALKLVSAYNFDDWFGGKDRPSSGNWGQSEPTHKCETDPGACQCCLTMQRVDDVRSRLVRKLDELETELNQTNQTYMELTTRRSAFTAALFDNKNNLNCLGRFSDTRTIMYKKVFTNLGGNYSPATGIYTAPYNGVYSFSVSVFHDAGQGSDEQSCVLLYVNGAMLAGSNDIHTFDHEDSTTVSITIHLNTGDQVKVQLQAGCLLCMIKDHYNVFSGFLLYAD
ncbi:hypothetical protein NL108_002637 [Boleophthalmus pectinirostris]|uniref:uncharacterized protein LOC129407254 n=1 Tax=Boleophthalmus pectinirostris TaxID=150288 RepID=UPI00242CC742|nr:uncharacterized protein LOC129407254 [Boleophthalmus pectinirostris]KAJ0063379.1 hypothetical protein NL108_002637 [Boleophthalmus pectinirostris]